MGKLDQPGRKEVVKQGVAGGEGKDVVETRDGKKNSGAVESPRLRVPSSPVARELITKHAIRFDRMNAPGVKPEGELVDDVEREELGVHFERKEPRLDEERPQA